MVMDNRYPCPVSVLTKERVFVLYFDTELCLHIMIRIYINKYTSTAHSHCHCRRQKTGHTQAGESGRRAERAKPCICVRMSAWSMHDVTQTLPACSRTHTQDWLGA